MSRPNLSLSPKMGVREMRLKAERVLPSKVALELNEQLDALHKSLEPHDEVHLNNLELISKLERVFRKKNWTFCTFGSFANELASNVSDLDLCVFVKKQAKPMRILRDIERIMFEFDDFRNLQVIPARIPVLKGNYRDVSFDISFGEENHRFSILRDRLIRIYKEADDRFLKLFFALRWWLNSLDLGDAKSAGLNSLSTCMLLIFFLQQYRLLPVLQLPYEHSDFLEPFNSKSFQNIDDTWRLRLDKWMQDPETSKAKSSAPEHIGELLVLFFEYYSHINHDWAISVRLGNFLPRVPLDVYSKNKIWIEDPVWISNNSSRAFVKVSDMTTFMERTAYLLKRGQGFDQQLIKKLKSPSRLYSDLEWTVPTAFIKSMKRKKML